MNSPLVSICITAYNGEPFIRKSLESAIHQTFKDIEIVVGDDAGTDDTGKIVLEYAAKDSRIKYFRNEKNLRCSGNYLKTIQQASGRFIQWLAQDDWLDPRHIEEKISIFQRYPDVALVASHVETYRKDKNQLVLIEKIHKRPGLYPSSYAIRTFYKKPGLFGAFSMTRKKDLERDLLIDIPNKYGYNDYYKFMTGETLSSLSILSRYPHMYYTDKVRYNVLDHDTNDHKTCWPNAYHNISDRIKFFHINRVGLEHFFKNKGKEYLFNFRVLTGSEMLVTAIKDLARLGPKTFSSKQLSLFFDDYSFTEKIGTLAYVLPHALKRVFNWGVRKTQKIRTLN